MKPEGEMMHRPKQTTEITRVMASHFKAKVSEAPTKNPALHTLTDVETFDLTQIVNLMNLNPGASQVGSSGGSGQVKCN